MDRRSEQLLLSRRPQPHPSGDDRERIMRARQAAEALFTPRPQVAEPLAADSLPPTDQPVRRPRVLGISSSAPARLGELEAPVAPEPQTTPEIPLIEICAHPQPGKIRHDRFPGRQGYGLRSARSSAFSGRPDGAAASGRELRASTVGKKSATRGTLRFRVLTRSRAAWWGTTLKNPEHRTRYEFRERDQDPAAQLCR